jgi:hypothetical protein
MDGVVREQVSFLEGTGSLFGDREVFALEPVGLSNVPHPINEQIAFEKAILIADQPEATNEQFRDIGDGYYQLLFQHPPSSLTWQLDLGEHFRIVLRSGLLVAEPQDPEFEPSDGVLFEVSIDNGEHVNPVFQRLVMPSSFEEGFAPIEIDLSQYAGQTVELILSTHTGTTMEATPNYDWAYWHYPELILDQPGE